MNRVCTIFCTPSKPTECGNALCHYWLLLLCAHASIKLARSKTRAACVMDWLQPGCTLELMNIGRRTSSGSAVPTFSDRTYE